MESFKVRIDKGLNAHFCLFNDNDVLIIEATSFAVAIFRLLGVQRSLVAFTLIVR
jgi:hypothetical protein